MPRANGRAGRQKDTLDSRERGKTEAVWFYLFIYFSSFFSFSQKELNAQKLPKCTANICTAPYLTAFNAHVFLLPAA